MNHSACGPALFVAARGARVLPFLSARSLLHTLSVCARRSPHPAHRARVTPVCATDAADADRMSSASAGSASLSVPMETAAIPAVPSKSVAMDATSAPPAPAPGSKAGAPSSAGAGPSADAQLDPPVPGTLGALDFTDNFVAALPQDPVMGRETRQVREAAFSLVDPTPPDETDDLPVWRRGMAEGSMLPPPPLLVRALAGWSPAAAKLIGIRRFSSKDAAHEIAVLGGFGELCRGMRPYAANYGGHQFGQWAGQLGDGRAITLGETSGWELQLKGAGRTPYSRNADGRAVLRSSIREFLCSESMHFLGVPTTRALSLVTTGAGVIRDMFYTGQPQLEPGAVVCRMAPSFLRLGSFQLPVSRGEFELLEQIAAHAIDNHFPDLQVPVDGNRYTEFVREVSRRNAIMVARWMAVGFVHGVMNTDNFSILGLTIDYGPYGFLDGYDPEYTPNSSDMAQRRYKYGTQPDVARWNILQFVQAMVPLTSVAEMQKVVDEFPLIYEAEYNRLFAAKLGIAKFSEPEDTKLLSDFLDMLAAQKLDFTNSWRTLGNVSAGMHVEQAMAIMEGLFAGRPVERMHWDTWLTRYLTRLQTDEMHGLINRMKRKKMMDNANPAYILRNYMAQTAIEKASDGDFGEIESLYWLLTRPYEEQKGMEKYTYEPPDWAQKRGVRVNSCSS